MTLDNIHLPFQTWIVHNPISYDHCFLCWAELTDVNRTIEHVFPKWMQHDFSLLTQPLTLPNKTWIPYRQVCVPCCQNCNNEHLSQLEDEISTGVRQGFDFFLKNVPKLRQFQWLQCLMYKVLYRDMGLKEDRSDPQSGTLTTALDLALLRLSHLFLRSMDKHVIFKNFFPASIYVVRVKTSPDTFKNFDYIDSIPDQCLAIRMNDIGIIAILRDGNLHEQCLSSPLPDGILDRTFNPIQFRNLFAKLLYQQMLFNDPFNYIVNPIDSDTVEIEGVLREQEAGRDAYVYGPANQENYGKVLAQVLGTTLDSLRLPNGSIGSLLFHKNGQWKERPFDDNGSAGNETESIQPKDSGDSQ